jgi:hypothetical protein
VLYKKNEQKKIPRNFSYFKSPQNAFVFKKKCVFCTKFFLDCLSTFFRKNKKKTIVWITTTILLTVNLLG